MITELGKRCQEMTRIKEFASFKSELLGALGGPRPLDQIVSRPWISVVASLKNSLVTAMYDQVNDINLVTKNGSNY
jgi:hypothetical protein